jgi:hypothetical protein
MDSYVERLEGRLKDAENLMRELLEYHEARAFYDLGKIQMFLRRAWPQPEDSVADGASRILTVDDEGKLRVYSERED